MSFWDPRLAYNSPQSILRSVTTINLMIFSIEQNNHINVPKDVPLQHQNQRKTYPENLI